MPTNREKLEDLFGQIENRLDTLSAVDYPNKLQPYTRGDSAKFLSSPPAIALVINKLNAVVDMLNQAIDIEPEAPPQHTAWITQQIMANKANKLGDTDKQG